MLAVEERVVICVPNTLVQTAVSMQFVRDKTTIVEVLSERAATSNGSQDRLV